MENKQRYVIVLPETGVSVPGFSKVPKIGVSSAYGSRQAVSQYLFRTIPQGAKLAMNQLDQRIGAENCAIEVPEITFEDGTPLTGSERETAEENYLAQDFARQRGLDITSALRIARSVLGDAREQERLSRIATRVVAA